MSSLLVKGKLEAQFGIRLAAKEFHDIFSGRPHHVSNMAPTKIKNCAMHQGDWGKKGAVIVWDYIHDGVPKVAKEVVEEIDEVNMSTTFRVIEGDITKDYKEFKITIQAISESNETSLIKVTLKYEKLKEDFPETDAISILNFVVHMSKDIDDHHTNNKIKSNDN
ncbi:MLP-like protein 31 [Linum grandiflorum]